MSTHVSEMYCILYLIIIIVITTSIKVLSLFTIGVEFGARMITIDGKQIKLQIWDTVRTGHSILIVRII